MVGKASQKGISFLPLVIIVLLVGVALFIFSGHGKPNIPGTAENDPPPTVYNLGINFDDFEFTNYDLSHYNNKVFLEYGSELSGPAGVDIIPHPTYILPPGVEITAVTPGTVKSIKYQEEFDDYSLAVSVDNSSWTVDYDHVANLKVEKGDKVEAGQVIAESPLETGALRQGNLGFTEIMIFKDAGFRRHGEQTACLFNLLDESVKDEYHERIFEFVSEWEEFKGEESIYDEENWVSPGCIVDGLKEGN